MHFIANISIVSYGESDRMAQSRGFSQPPVIRARKINVKPVKEIIPFIGLVFNNTNSLRIYLMELLIRNLIRLFSDKYKCVFRYFTLKFKPEVNDKDPYNHRQWFRP